MTLRLTLLAAVFAAVCMAQISSRPAGGVDLGAMDPTSDPCVNFYLIFYTMSAEVVHSRLVAILKTA